VSYLTWMISSYPKREGKNACVLLYRRVKKKIFDAGLIINEPKCQLELALCLRQHGLDVDTSGGKFRVPVDRREVL
jgi:hypothetical protein